MSRLLSSPAILPERQRLGSATVLSEEIRQLVERERAEAYARGRADGMAEAAAAAHEANGAAVAALRNAVEQEIGRLHDARTALDANMLDMVAQMAAYVVDTVDTSTVDDVTRRIRTALADIDDTRLVAHVHSSQAEAVTRAFVDTELRVVASDDVPVGDARLIGRWSVADLGQQQRWLAIQEMLDAAS